MSEITVFDYDNIRTFLEEQIRSPMFGRGTKAKIAQELACQPSYVSQVLNGQSFFSAEQALKVSRFFKLNRLEEEYFMTLLQVDRAGTKELSDYYDYRREEILEKSKLVENQMEYDKLSDANTIAFLNDWRHIQVRSLVEIPKYQYEKPLQKKLGVDDGEFSKIMGFMYETGLILKGSEGQLSQGQVRIHIEKKSPLAKYGNFTARMQILKNYDKSNEESLNYTFYMTLTKKKLEEFKKKLVAIAVDINEQVDQPDEDPEIMAALVIDLMEV